MAPVSTLLVLGGPVVGHIVWRQLNVGKDGVRGDVSFKHDAVGAQTLDSGSREDFARPRPCRHDHVRDIVDGAYLPCFPVLVLDALHTIGLIVVDLGYFGAQPNVDTLLSRELRNGGGEMEGVHLSGFCAPGATHLLVVLN
jgi:hypothetical protein